MRVLRRAQRPGALFHCALFLQTHARCSSLSHLTNVWVSGKREGKRFAYRNPGFAATGQKILERAPAAGQEAEAPPGQGRLREQDRDALPALTMQRTTQQWRDARHGIDRAIAAQSESPSVHHQSTISSASVEVVAPVRTFMAGGLLIAVASLTPR